VRVSNKKLKSIAEKIFLTYLGILARIRHSPVRDGENHVKKLKT
jgi:hypothetical protein